MFPGGRAGRAAPTRRCTSTDESRTGATALAMERVEQTMIDRLRREWAKTSNTSKIVLGAVLAVALVVMVLSITGAIDLAPVQTGVTQVKKG